jgi:hypothetical protein
MITPDALAAGIRDATDEEVEHYEQHGWVMLRGLVARELVAELLERAGPALAGSERNTATFLGRSALATDGVEPFRSVAFSPQMGRVAQRLTNRRRLCGVDYPIRFHSDHVFCKAPGCSGTPYHQDGASQGADRIGEFNMWLALDEVTPEMGAMRFLTGSHRDGPLGVNIPEGEREPERDYLKEHYPKLWELYELSPPFHYQAGDATVHKGHMLHGAPPNETDRNRWSYILQYTPADTRYIDGTTVGDNERVAELALPLDEDKNPIVAD